MSPISFVPEVCHAIVEEYENQVFSTPTTPDEWREVEDTFRERCNYPQKRFDVMNALHL